MAIINPTSGVNPKKVVEGVMFTTSSTGSVQAVQSTNNRTLNLPTNWRKGSLNTSKFSALDSLITHLDASYELSTHQGDWIGYATNIDGEWQLCANCQPDASGKKLYRQYNFNRALQGLPAVDVPVDNTERAFTLGVSIFYASGFGLPAPICRVTTDDSDPGLIYNPQVGALLANPIYSVPAIDDGVPVTSGPTFNWGVAVLQATVGIPSPTGDVFGDVPACVFMPDGAPGNTTLISMEVHVG